MKCAEPCNEKEHSSRALCGAYGLTLGISTKNNFKLGCV